VKRPGSRLIATALVLLFGLGLGLLAVSYAAQYRYVVGQRHQVAASAIEAGCLDVALMILSLLALGLARRGLSSSVERALVVIVALGSAGMNYAASDPSSPRSVIAYAMPPLLLAIIVDRTVATVRRHYLGMADGRSPWAVAGRSALYGMRLVVAPASTCAGLRAALLRVTPLAVPPGTGRAALSGPQGVPPGTASASSAPGAPGLSPARSVPSAVPAAPGRASERAGRAAPARGEPVARSGGREPGRATVPPRAVPLPVSDRSGLEHARASYRASVAAARPKSARALAAEHGISRRQAARIVGETGPALALVSARQDADGDREEVS
jgi:hypothetical protein